jgi:hypothetical protein
MQMSGWSLGAAAISTMRSGVWIAVLHRIRDEIHQDQLEPRNIDGHGGQRPRDSHIDTAHLGHLAELIDHVLDHRRQFHALHERAISASR